MKLGMFMMPLHPPGRNAWETLAEDREAIILADRLGYNEALVGEHVTDLAENVTSCLMFLASVASETKNIVLGSGTINMPNSHPAAIAAQVAMLDHILQGRFIMGISPGGLMSDAEVFGNYQKDRNAIFLESINMVLEIWRREAPYDLTGQFFNVSTARTMIPEIGQGTILKPFQRPHPPIVVTAVAPHSKGITEAAKRGWRPISANFLLPEWVATHWPRYVEGRAAVGAEASPSEWTVAKSIFVADDEATAKRYGLGSEGPYHFYFKQLVRKLVSGGRSNLFKVDQSIPDADITPEYVTNNLVIAGTVNSVVDQLLAFREKTGDFGTLYYACHDWMDPALGRRSMQLLAEEVMPRVNAAIAASKRIEPPIGLASTRYMEMEALDTVTVGDVQLAYRFDGPANAPVVMLANSILSDMSVWNANIAALSERYRVLRYDMRGNGQSGVTSAPYTVEALADDAVGLLDALGVERVHFIGLSLGGMVGQQLAARHPQRLLSLSLCDTASEQHDRAAWESRIATVRERGVQPLVDGTVQRWFTPAFVESSPQVIKRISAMIMATSVEGYVGCASAVRDVSQTELLAAIRTPTLVVVGRDDMSTTEVQSRQMHARIAGSEFVVIDQAAHLPNIEQAATFNRTLVDFVDRAEAARKAAR